MKLFDRFIGIFGFFMLLLVWFPQLIFRTGCEEFEPIIKTASGYILHNVCVNPYSYIDVVFIFLFIMTAILFDKIMINERKLILEGHKI